MLRNMKPIIVESWVENLKRPVMNRDWINSPKSPNKEKPRTRVFAGEFYWTLKEELMPIFPKLFQKNWSVLNHSPNHFMKLDYQDIKDKGSTRKENSRQCPWWTLVQKFSTKYLQNNPTAHKTDHTPWPAGIDPWNARMAQHMRINKSATSH